MPYYYKSPKSLIVQVAILQVFLFASLPLGHAVVPEILSGLVNVSQIEVTGRLLCTTSGNVDPAAGSGSLGAAGTLISGSCNGASGDLGTIITNSTGFFDAVFSLPLSILFNTTQGVPCDLIVKLPATRTTCQLFLPTGILRARLQLLNLDVNALGHIIARLIALPFQHLP